MNKKVSVFIIVVVLAGLGCQEEMVGAPCVSETDSRVFSNDLLSGESSEDDITWSIESGSVQCATNVCLTQTKINPDGDASRKDDCIDDPSPETCGTVWDGDKVLHEPLMLKFSFCSCRCEDGEGNKKSDNPDKYDDLCECPPSTVCVNVLDKIGGTEISEKLFGGYCIPECINEACASSSADDHNLGEVCTPSENSEEPWLWSCEKISK